MEVLRSGNGSIRSGEWKYQIWGMEVSGLGDGSIRSGEWKYQNLENGNADLRNRNLGKEIKGKLLSKNEMNWGANTKRSYSDLHNKKRNCGMETSRSEESRKAEIWGPG